MAVVIQGAARQALAELRERLTDALDRAGVDAVAVGEELFGVLHFLAREHVVRRTLSDASVRPERKAQLARRLFSGQTSGVTSDIVEALVRARWSSPTTMLDCLEVLAVESEVVAADRAGSTDDFEDELFRFGRIVDGRPALRSALSDRAVPADRKRELVETLLRDKASPSTLRLVVEAVTSPRNRTLQDTLEYYLQIAADHERRLVATVRAAVPLTEAERDRLAAALRRQYERDVRLNVEIDPAVIGGMSVVVGSDLIEGTLARRIDEVRRRLAG
ncbi:MAG: F0F1 ATP synthase subunit delta [Streptosporangiales bacterium]|nr:F0F1 ATP synthase subunit delta [Streptosporangiales bacterium]MBO0889974.1 F0F1 ATP synthase subunit delta [Acidothermales bacterium]